MSESCLNVVDTFRGSVSAAMIEARVVNELRVVVDDKGLREAVHQGSKTLLDGELLLNPHLIEHLRLAREYWPSSNLMVVTNGFFFDRHPDFHPSGSQ